MNLSESCPSCDIKKWTTREFEIMKTFVEITFDNNNSVVPKGTLVRQFSCSNCGFVIKQYQKPNNVGGSGGRGNNDYTSGGAPGTPYSRHV